MSTYVYGIADRSHPTLPDGTTGVGEPARTVRTVVEDGLAAVVSDAPEGLRPRRSELMAHQKVLRRAETEGPVLPMRFGSIAPDDAAVRSVLARRGAHFRERLRILAGRDEYRVTGAHNPAAVLRLVLAENPEIRALGDVDAASGGGSRQQRLHLGRLVVAAVRDVEAEDARQVYEALEPAAAGVQAGPESTAWPVNVSFLVDRESAGAFRRAVDRVRAARPHLRLRVDGPLPPYSFVEPGPAPSAVPAPARRTEAQTGYRGTPTGPGRIEPEPEPARGGASGASEEDEEGGAAADSRPEPYGWFHEERVLHAEHEGSEEPQRPDDEADPADPGSGDTAPGRGEPAGDAGPRTVPGPAGEEGTTGPARDAG